MVTQDAMHEIRTSRIEAGQTNDRTEAAETWTRPRCLPATPRLQRPSTARRHRFSDGTEPATEYNCSRRHAFDSEDSGVCFHHTWPINGLVNCVAGLQVP